MKLLKNFERKIFEEGKEKGFIKGELNNIEVDFEKNHKYLIGDAREIKRILIENNLSLDNSLNQYLNTDLFNQYEFGVTIFFLGYYETLNSVKFEESKDCLKVIFYFTKRDSDLNI